MPPRSVERARHAAHGNRVGSPLFQRPLACRAGIRDGGVGAEDCAGGLCLGGGGEGDLGCVDGGDFLGEDEEVWFCGGDWVWEGVGEDVGEDEGEFGLEVKVGYYAGPGSVCSGMENDTLTLSRRQFHNHVSNGKRTDWVCVSFSGEEREYGEGIEEMG